MLVIVPGIKEPRERLPNLNIFAWHCNYPYKSSDRNHLEIYAPESCDRVRLASKAASQTTVMLFFNVLEHASLLESRPGTHSLDGGTSSVNRPSPYPVMSRNQNQQDNLLFKGHRKTLMVGGCVTGPAQTGMRLANTKTSKTITVRDVPEHQRIRWFSLACRSSNTVLLATEYKIRKRATALALSPLRIIDGNF